MDHPIFAPLPPEQQAMISIASFYVSLANSVIMALRLIREAWTRYAAGRAVRRPPLNASMP